MPAGSECFLIRAAYAPRPKLQYPHPTRNVTYTSHRAISCQLGVHPHPTAPSGGISAMAKDESSALGPALPAPRTPDSAGDVDLPVLGCGLGAS